MSVSADIISKSLAPALGLDESTVETWVSTVLHRAVEELMLSGSVQLSGIGLLKKTHIPSEPHDFGNGKLGLMPPRARVELLPEESDDGGFIYDVALGDLKLDEDAAEKFAKGFSRVVEKVLEAKGSLAVGRLGALIRSDVGAVSFQESTWLGEFLNKPYKNLAPVLISGDDDDAVRPAQGKDFAPVAFKPSDFGLDSPPPKKQEPKTNDFSFSPSKIASEKKDDAKSDQDKKRERFQPPVPIIEEGKSVIGDGVESKYESTYPFKEPPKIQNDPPPDLTRLMDSSNPPDATKRLLTIGGSTLAAVIFVVGLFYLLNQLGRVEQPENSPAKSAEPSKTKNDATEKSSDKKTEPVKSAPSKVDVTKVDPPKSESPKPEPKTETKPEPKVESKPDSPKPTVNTGLPAELSMPVNESKGGWTIVVASRPSEAEAKTVAADFAKKGFATSVKARTVNGETRYRVRVGQFEKQGDASKAIKQQSALLPQGAFLDKIQ